MNIYTHRRLHTKTERERHTCTKRFLRVSVCVWREQPTKQTGKELPKGTIAKLSPRHRIYPLDSKFPETHQSCSRHFGFVQIERAPYCQHRINEIHSAQCQRWGQVRVRIAAGSCGQETCATWSQRSLCSKACDTARQGWKSTVENCEDLLGYIHQMFFVVTSLQALEATECHHFDPYLQLFHRRKICPPSLSVRENPQRTRLTEVVVSHEKVTEGSIPLLFNSAPTAAKDQ